MAIRNPTPQISSSYSFFAVAAAAVVALLLAPPSSAAAAARSDPLRARAELIRKQASDHAAVAAAYASFARKLKLETSKQVRLFADLSRNFSLLLSPSSSSSAAAAAAAMDEAELRRFERQVKDRIRAARAVIADAKGAFDAQLKIQRLKDAIFAANERLSKAKKQGAFSSLIAAKSIPRSLHCLAVRLTEERIAHPALYSPSPTPPPELDDPASSTTPSSPTTSSPPPSSSIPRSATPRSRRSTYSTSSPIG
ncbi:Galacturonosyltransferase 8 [Ananas comosus]|uniref:Galacturonosyltransferase 8 n=1 Tax=Ananas comosus TaxID=4615 RepID=A0A199VNL6_ANACO|nr:Galacturonosyltransferase 8 [Ananas comosus]